jgi:hypothetical protein
VERRIDKRQLHKFRIEPFAYYVYAVIIIAIVIVIIMHYLVTTPSIQSPENLNWYRRFLYFDYMFILFFSITSFIGGFIMAYMGFGGNRKIGIYFIVLSVIIFIMGFYYFDQIFPRPLNNPSNVYQALVSVLATISGFLAAILVAFLIIIKVRTKFKEDGTVPLDVKLLKNR